MKLGKTKIVLMLLLALVMAFALVACDNDDSSSTASCDCCENCTACICEAGKDCNPDCTCGNGNCNPAPAADTTAPVITFAEGKQDSYTMTAGQTLTLPLATANDETDGSVEVTVTAEGATVTKDTQGYVFTAEEAGTYSVVYSAQDATGNKAQQTITVTVVADEVAPVITFAEGKQNSYTVTAGQTLTLPLATATDNVDGEVNVEVSVTTKGATVTKATDGYTFASVTAGSYQVSYYAIDEAENEAEEFITVTVTPVVDETALPEGASDDITVLENGGTFVENFAKGYNSTFAKGMSYSTAAGEPNASIKGDQAYIAGNSLIIDYSSCAWNTNTQFWFGAVDKYLKSGKWTISMDVKVLGGTAPSGLYFSFIYDGDNSGENEAYPLGAVGETKTITQQVQKNFDETKTWHFRIFFYTGNSNYKYDNFVIAIDNITITYKAVVNDVVERTGTPKTVTIEEATATGGYTLTGADDNYTALTGAALYADISKISASERLTAEQAANLTAANGFNSNYAIVANTQVITFGALKNLCTDTSYIFTLTMKVYAPSANNWHIFFTNGSGAQSGAKQQPNVKGPATFSYEFAGAANYVNIGLYNGSISPVYIGDITITAVAKAADKSPNGYEVGKKWTRSAAELNLGSKGTSVTCSEVTVGDSALSSYAGFTDKAIHFKTTAANTTCELFRTNGTLENGCKYKITLNVYVVECDGRLMLNFDNAKFPDLGNAKGYRTIEIEWTADTSVDFFSFYFPDSTAELYISGLTYELISLT